jgi:hypothetical protein
MGEDDAVASRHVEIPAHIQVEKILHGGAGYDLRCAVDEATALEFNITVAATERKFTLLEPEVR